MTRRISFHLQGQDDPTSISDLDRRLSSIRFEPRASLGPELRGQVGRVHMQALPAQRAAHPLVSRIVLALVATLAFCLLCAAVAELFLG